MVPKSLYYELCVATPFRQQMNTNKVYKFYNVLVSGRELEAYLILLDMFEFDVIFGMDWLSTFHASVECFGKKVVFRIPRETEFFFEGDRVVKPPLLVSAIQARQLLRKGCEGSLACALKGDKIELKVEDILVVKEFPYEFSDDLLGLPPNKAVEFTIDLGHGTSPISKGPYRMALAKLKKGAIARLA